MNYTDQGKVSRVPFAVLQYILQIFHIYSDNIFWGCHSQWAVNVMQIWCQLIHYHFGQTYKQPENLFWMGLFDSWWAFSERECEAWYVKWPNIMDAFFVFNGSSNYLFEFLQWKTCKHVGSPLCPPELILVFITLNFSLSSQMTRKCTVRGTSASSPIASLCRKHQEKKKKSHFLFPFRKQHSCTWDKSCWDCAQRLERTWNTRSRKGPTKPETVSKCLFFHEIQINPWVKICFCW